ncbi:hypothetical protein CIHG_07929 [Coccidioides immitis H538.4]|uniref:Glycosyl hydrolase family 92 domain-containing protein n=2 Tax=Coccidioides immitis TaxID=5501 RepID=A0A0J8S180_COCIT|nr:hypothetical protein CIRG_10139 [Coccidioides immitis RMSCC 2394]KMU90119.1 hypothetical protein CIHG_07929 [Coccidioides immitis H538.4]
MTPKEYPRTTTAASWDFSCACNDRLYPVHGENVYLIMPPFFQGVSIKNSSKGDFTVIGNSNFDTGYENIYLRSLKGDGNAWMNNWIRHDFFSGDGVLELTLEAYESAWWDKQRRFTSQPPNIFETTLQAVPKLGVHLD